MNLHQETLLPEKSKSKMAQTYLSKIKVGRIRDQIQWSDQSEPPPQKLETHFTAKLFLIRFSLTKLQLNMGFFELLLTALCIITTSIATISARRLWASSLTQLRVHLIAKWLEKFCYTNKKNLTITSSSTTFSVPPVLAGPWFGQTSSLHWKNKFISLKETKVKSSVICLSPQDYLTVHFSFPSCENTKHSGTHCPKHHTSQITAVFLHFYPLVWIEANSCRTQSSSFITVCIFPYKQQISLTQASQGVFSIILAWAPRRTLSSLVGQPYTLCLTW